MILSGKLGIYLYKAPALKELNKTCFLEVQVADVQAQKKMIDAQKQMRLNPGLQNKSYKL